MIKWFVVFLSLLILWPTKSNCQKHSNVTADFALMEKNTRDTLESLVVGKIKYQKQVKETKFEIIFPEKELWQLKDSILYKYIKDSIVSKTKIGNFDQFSIFNEVLSLSSNDFGLKKAGFKIKKLENREIETIIEWSPPMHLAKFIKSAITMLSDNILQAVSFVDINDKEISTSFFSDFQIIKGLPFPMKVSSKWAGQGSDFYKILTFTDVKID